MKIISIILTALVIAGCSGGDTADNTSVYGKEIDSIAAICYQATEYEIAVPDDKGLEYYTKLEETVAPSYWVKIAVPNFVRARILDTLTAKFYPNVFIPEQTYPSEPELYPEHKFVITKVYKGYKLKVGDTLFFNSWELTQFATGWFTIGEEYLLPLRYSRSYYDTYVIASSYFNGKGEYAKFLIKDGIFYDPSSFWNMGTEVPLDEFEEAFMKDIDRLNVLGPADLRPKDRWR